MPSSATSATEASIPTTRSTVPSVRASALAWNPRFDGDGLGSKIFGHEGTVIRGGYGRVYGRLNGVDLVLVPLLGVGLIQPVQCTQALASGQCGPANPTDATAFRVGVDGNTAPLAAASPTLPQPVYPGYNNGESSAAEGLDPNFRPNVSDSFDLTIQRQINRQNTLEVGYIGRLIHHEYQPVDLNVVPYMMVQGGQDFKTAYAALETALGCAKSVAACGRRNAFPRASLRSRSLKPHLRAQVTAPDTPVARRP